LLPPETLEEKSCMKKEEFVWKKEGGNKTADCWRKRFAHCQDFFNKRIMQFDAK
jgi:hypothetical protein